MFVVRSGVHRVHAAKRLRYVLSHGSRLKRKLINLPLVFVVNNAMQKKQARELWLRRAWHSKTTIALVVREEAGWLAQDHIPACIYFSF